MSTNDQNTAFVPLGNVATSVKGKKPAVLKEKSADGMVPYIDIEAFEDGVFKRYTDPAKTVLCEDGDVLMVWDGSRSGLVGRGRAGAIGSTLAKIEVPHVEKPYLFYFLESLYPIINSRAKGVGIPHVNPELLWSSLFPVVSQRQQRLVVSKIEELVTELEASVKELEAAQVELKRYRASVLAAACSGKLVPTEAKLAKSEGRSYESGVELLGRILKDRREKWNGRGKYKGPASADTTGLPELPEGWVWASLDQLSFDSSYGTSVKCNYTDTGIPVLRIPNVQAGRIDLNDLKFATKKVDLATGDELVPGDLLIIRTNGSRNLIGRSAVIKEKLLRQTTYASYLIRFRLASERALFDWIAAIWNASFLREWVESHASTSAGQHNISMTTLATMPLPLPPLSEQERIAREVDRRLSVSDEVERVLSANLYRSEKLRQAILQQAFSGKLVPQDASDEPAATLLERISAERVDATPKKKVTSKRGRPRATAK